jgi:hypothetical protein
MFLRLEPHVTNQAQTSNFTSRNRPKTDITFLRAIQSRSSTCVLIPTASTRLSQWRYVTEKAGTVENTYKMYQTMSGLGKALRK